MPFSSNEPNTKLRNRKTKTKKGKKNLILLGEKKVEKKKEFKNTEETKRKTEKLKIKTKETKKFNSSTNSYIVHTRT